MRRASAAAAAAACSTSRAALPLSTSSRLLRPPLSPDRNRNETIADRQQRFRYTDHHRVRPHQHYTHDPTNWNREAFNEAVKKRNGQAGLSITQRLNNLDEQAAMQKQNYAMMMVKQTSSSSSSTNNVPSSAAADEEEKREKGLSLIHKGSRRLDSLVRHRHQWSCPRYARDRCSADTMQCVQRYQLQLLRGLEWLRTYGAEISPSLQCALWAELLQGAEPLLEALERISKNGIEEEIVSIFALLQSQVFLEQKDVPVSPMDLESHIHRLYILTHPFVKNSVKLAEAISAADRQRRALSVVSFSTIGFHAAEETMRALRERQQQEGSAEDGSSSWTSQLTAPQLRMLWTSLDRLPLEGEWEEWLPVLLQACRHEVHGLADCAQSIFRHPSAELKRQLAPVDPNNVPQALLSRPQRRRNAVVSGGRFPSIEFTGIKQPVLTDPDDVKAACECVGHAVRRLPGGNPGLELAASRILLDLLELLDYSPNYDLDTSAILTTFAAVVQSGIDLPNLRHRLLTVLSRFQSVHLQSDEDRLQCLTTVLQLRAAGEQSPVDEDDKEEVLRLEGQVLHNVLSVLTANVLGTLLVDEMQSSVEVTTLDALVHTGTTIPLALWRSFAHFIESDVRSIALENELSDNEVELWLAALSRPMLALRTQCRPSQLQSHRTLKQDRPFFPLEEWDERILCVLLAHSFPGASAINKPAHVVAETLFETRNAVNKRPDGATMWEAMSVEVDKYIRSKVDHQANNNSWNAVKRMLRELVKIS